MRPFVIGLIALAATVVAAAGFVLRLDLRLVFAGVFALGLLSLAIAIRAGRLAFFKSWTGGRDERRGTQKVLKPLLDQGWQARHSVEIERAGGDDHLLLSPSGVAYVIETRALEGTVSLNDGVLTQRFGDDPFAVGRHDLLPRRDLVSRVAAEWSRQTGALVPEIRTIIVVWGDFRDSIVDHDGVLYVAGTELAEVLPRLEGTPKAHGRWV
jgi:hypothetical protein